MTEEKNLNRRSFFGMVVAAATIVPFVLKSVKAEAAACPTAAPAGKAVAVEGVGMAKGLDYVADGKSSKNAKHKPGDTCGNCKYYNEKKADGGYAPCTMMGMKFVTNCGWCKSHLTK